MAPGDRRLPERLTGPDGLLLRRWRPKDAQTLSVAVAESTDHLLTVKQRRSMLMEWERDWMNGGDVVLGIFLDGHVVGGCGVHRRVAADGVELGYWVHPRCLRRGLASAAARLMTEGSLALPSITHVEIHHDKANVASAGVPRRLGFRLVAEVPDEIEAPSEIGIECRWRMDPERWASATQR